MSPGGFFLVFVALLSAGSDQDGLQTLRAWMTGSFSSASQAASDPDYSDIRLEMAPIWVDRSDGPWLYVEQAAAISLDKPYRQRIYRLAAMEDGTFRSEVYLIPDPMRFAGAFRDPAKFRVLAPAALELRAGCAVVLSRQHDGRYKGGTLGESCASDLRGARYATSDVVVAADGLETWDRGFAEAGRQVWGATKGPYRFARVSASGSQRGRQ